MIAIDTFELSGKSTYLLLDALSLEQLALLFFDLLVDFGASRGLVAISTSGVSGLLVLLGLLSPSLLLCLLARLSELVLDRLFVFGIERLVRLGLTLLMVLSVIVVMHADIRVGARRVALVAIGTV